MKKTFTLSLFAIACLSFTASSASAGVFGLFKCCGFGCKKKCYSLHVKPYNAFTPFCSGCVTCAGMPCHAPMHHGGHGHMGHCCPPACLPDCGAHGCRALPTLPSAQAVANAPVQPQTPAMTHSVGYRGAPAAAPVQPMAQGYYNPYYNAGYGYGYGYYPQMQMNYPGYWNWNMGR